MKINVDAELSNADWPKRTPDTLEDLRAGARQEKRRAGKAADGRSSPQQRKKSPPPNEGSGKSA